MDRAARHPGRDPAARPRREQAITVDRVPARAGAGATSSTTTGTSDGAPTSRTGSRSCRSRGCTSPPRTARLLVHGISREPFFRTLTGTGHTIGARSTPAASGRSSGAASARSSGDGACRPATCSASTTGRSRPTSSATSTCRRWWPPWRRYLLALDPRPDPVVAEVRALVAAAEQDRAITRAEQLADRAATSLRSLQRLFTDYVGVGPKWVIARFRILDAAAAAHGGGAVDWAALADRARLHRPGPPHPRVHRRRRHPAGDLRPRGVPLTRQAACASLGAGRSPRARRPARSSRRRRPRPSPRRGAARRRTRCAAGAASSAHTLSDPQPDRRTPAARAAASAPARAPRRGRRTAAARPRRS